MNIHAHDIEFVSSFVAEDQITLMVNERDANCITLHFKTGAELRDMAVALNEMVSKLKKLERGEAA